VIARILLADDHSLVRRGLRQLIEREPDLAVVAEAADGSEAVERAVEHQVDLAILDVSMPALTGLQAATELRERLPETKVLLLSMYDSEQYVFAAERAGAAGYLLKSSADEEIVAACRAVLAGAPFVAPAGVGEPAHGPLTRRELEVLKQVAEGRTSREIADALVISVKTVERHRSNIMDKLGIRDRVQLARYAIRRGLVEP
jgi:DNA-binding NarL/FixJ family response regulator